MANEGILTPPLPGTTVLGNPAGPTLVPPPGAMPPLPSIATAIAAAAAISAEVKNTEERRDAADKLARDPAKSQLLTFLAARLDEAVQAKQASGMTDKLLEAQRRRKGEYSTTRRSELEKFGIPVFWVPITQIKCNDAEAHMREIYMPYGDKLYTIEPTPISDLPPEKKAEIEIDVLRKQQSELAAGFPMEPERMESVRAEIKERIKAETAEEAQKRAAGMEVAVADALTDAEFQPVFNEFRSNVVTYGTGFLKGPVIRNQKRQKWNAAQGISVVEEPIPTLDAPSPHDIFPSPWSVRVKDGYMIERIRSYRAAFRTFLGIPFYQDSEILEMLQVAPDGTAVMQTQAGDSERAGYEQKAVGATDYRLECWEYWGPVPGEMLQAWGIRIDKPELDYEVQVIWREDHVIKVMPNWNEMGTRPYFKSTYKPVTGSFWGAGLPHLMSASQDKANAAMCAMLDNMGWCSGPYGWFDYERMADPNDIKSHGPKKIYATKNENLMTTPPMQFSTVPAVFQELQAIYQSALADGDIESGVLSSSYGSDKVSGPAKTFSGFALLMSNAARGIRDALADIDTNGIGPMIRNVVDWLNEYSEDQSIKGDVRVVTKGSTGIFIKELQMQKITEYLDRTANPIDMQLLGPAFRLKLHKRMADMLKLDIRDLFPTDKEIDEMKEQMKAEARAKAQAAVSAAIPGQGTAAPTTEIQGGANTMGTARRLESQEVPVET